MQSHSLTFFFRYEYNPDFSKSISEELSETQGRNTLLILDGFDEVSHSFHDNCVIKSILCRQLLPECTVILTTRPSAKHILESVCQPQVDKHIEIIGFTEEERVRYINEVFSKEPKLQANFLKYMFLVPHIKSMMYIPLNCAIIAQVYYESQSSHHLAIPKTRTQLYKALTHSLLVRHMRMKESSFYSTSMLPEGLDEKHMEMFNILAKFAFESYHKGSYLGNSMRFHKHELKKVTFFKEDIPEGFVHFGFMNESIEMYAGKGVEQLFSFLHLSLQEYLAAWHLANTYSIEFQVAYHRLAVSAYQTYEGSNKKEEELLSSLVQQRSSLAEPAIFLAGISGFKYQSEDRVNRWEQYLCHDTVHVEDPSVLLRSLYEAQNPTALQKYLAVEDSRRNIVISYDLTAYDCYALSYRLAHSTDKFLIFVDIREDDVQLLETFVKGLDDHCQSTSPSVIKLVIGLQIESVKCCNTCLFWLTKAKCWTDLSEIVIASKCTINTDHVKEFLRNVGRVQLLDIHVDSLLPWDWLAALNSLNELKGFHITNEYDNALFDPEWSIAVFDIGSANVCSSILSSLLKSIQRSNLITNAVLSNITRETMAGVQSILLHCPSLATLELKRTRLGYDGILYICSALRNNTSLTHLVILDSLKPQKRERNTFSILSSMENCPLPSKTTCTDFLLQLNNILKNNTTLEKMKIQSGLFLPLSAGGDRECCQWTELGPLEQFNMGAVGCGISNLRRSYSSSDLSQPCSILLWDRFYQVNLFSMPVQKGVDFKKFFAKKKEERKKLFSLPSFTAPDTDVLQSFYGLDPRLKECLEISHLHQYMERLRITYQGLLGDIQRHIR